MNRAKTLEASPGLPSRPRYWGTGVSPAQRAEKCRGAATGGDPGARE
jgi:hypothetical protein